MNIHFATSKLQKEFNDDRALQKSRGKPQADKIKFRLFQLRAANHLEQLKPAPGHFHPLSEDKHGWLACNLDGPWRLIFEPDHDPLPVTDDGGLDWKKITQVRVLGVLNYHE